MSDEGTQGSIVALPGAEHAVAALEVRERDAEGFAAVRTLGVSETGELFGRLRHGMRLPVLLGPGAHASDDFAS